MAHSPKKPWSEASPSVTMAWSRPAWASASATCRADGNLDIVKTHFAADTPAVYTNNGKGEFRDDTLRSGLASETRFISWGVGVEDLDNDGNPDIFWVTGGIYPELQGRPDQPYQGPRIVFRSLGNGRFEELTGEAGPGIEALHCSRGCAFGDFDNDGDLDILVVNLNEPPSLLRNDVTGGESLDQDQTDRQEIEPQRNRRTGHRPLRRQIQAKEVLSQSSYLSVNDPRLHFGLGSAAIADVDIRWPLGGTEKLSNVAADQLIYVTEGSGITRTQKFGKQHDVAIRLVLAFCAFSSRSNRLTAPGNLPPMAGSRRPLDPDAYQNES